VQRTASAAVTAHNYIDIFNEAVREVVRLKFRFLRPYFGAPFGTLPPAYATDLRAFVVLSSGTLEQCVEDLAWAYTHEICDEIVAATHAHGFRVLPNAPAILLDLEESLLGRSHGVKRDHYKNVVESIGLIVKTTTAQDDAFKQLGILRGEGAHTYAITVKDPKDVWLYAREVLRVVRDFAIQSAGSPAGLVAV
jgi:hypothetical protein